MKRARTGLPILALAMCAAAAPQVTVLKLAVTNPASEARTENVAICIADLVRVEPDFKAVNAIVTSSDAASRGSSTSRRPMNGVHGGVVLTNWCSGIRATTTGWKDVGTSSC